MVSDPRISVSSKSSMWGGRIWKGRDNSLVSGRLQRSGLITMKSAKYSIMPFTTSWSSASANRSREDFFMMLLKSGVSQNPIACSKRSTTRTDVIFSVLWLSELVDQELYAF